MLAPVAETPVMLSATYGSSSCFNLDHIAGDRRINNDGWIRPPAIPHDFNENDWQKKIEQLIDKQPAAQPQESTMASGLRIVRVYVADTDENIPADKRLLHVGHEHVTELTDQELYFGLPIQDMLAKHNAFRATVTDKKQSEKFGREVKLEPIRIKDLKMVVVNVAAF